MHVLRTRREGANAHEERLRTLRHDERMRFQQISVIINRFDRVGNGEKLFLLEVKIGNNK